MAHTRPCTRHVHGRYTAVYSYKGSGKHATDHSNILQNDSKTYIVVHIYTR